jgi:hypothetical protein
LILKFDILGQEVSYGNHRFSNNEILNLLNENSERDEDLVFVWWLEKVFIDPNFNSFVEILKEKPWFGVLHVPLLTPNWAMYSQNNLAKLYFSKSWRDALKNCKGLICLSEHLAAQVRCLYPDIKIFSLKHPIGKTDISFDFNLFKQSKSISLIGAWLRDFGAFSELETIYTKQVLHNQYSKSYIKDRYARYIPSIHKRLANVKCLEFLSNKDYDALMCSTLVFLGLHETSANNAVCECISYKVPFVAKKHPAVIEYVGEDYPLLINNYSDIAAIEDADVLAAHDYLASNNELAARLSYENFLQNFSEIYNLIKGLE